MQLEKTAKACESGSEEEEESSSEEEEEEKERGGCDPMLAHLETVEIDETPYKIDENGVLYNWDGDDVGTYHKGVATFTKEGSD